jgi:hypothetical protein
MDEPHIVDAWLANQRLEWLEDYLRRGRPLASTPLEELCPRWVTLMRSWMESIRGFDHRERQDIEAEMQLRKVDPPFDLVKDVLETLRRKSKEHMDELLQDPARFARLEEKLAEEIEQFEATAKGGKN